MQNIGNHLVSMFTIYNFAFLCILWKLLNKVHMKVIGFSVCF